MLLGARQFFAARKAAPAWTNPYVSDGLVAMWDGEWNAGGGVHDPNATTWKDLIGGIELDIGSNSFGDKWFNSTQAVGAQSASESINLFQGTIEFVCESNTSSSSCFFRLGGYVGGYALGIFYTKPRTGDPYVCGIVQDISAYINLVDVRHIAVTYNGTGVRMLLNAVPVETFSGGTRAYGTVSIGGAGGRTSPLNGKVYCARAYSTILTDVQLAANYAVDKERFGLT